MPELEDQLTALAATIDWPVTPNLTSRVRVRLAVARAAWYRTRWAMVAAVFVVAAAGLVAYPPSRDAIASWLNLHTIIQRVTNPPTPSPQPSGPLGQRLGLGTPMTLEQAQSKVSWRVVLPVTLGQPDQVYYLAPPDGPSLGEVTLVYAERPGIKTASETGVAVLITEARGKVQEQFFAKILGPNVTLEQVTVNGQPGYWITGSPNEVVFIDANGNFRTETMRLATNTLIFDDNGTIVRIEGDLTKAQALQIAEAIS